MNTLEQTDKLVKHILKFYRPLKFQVYMNINGDGVPVIEVITDRNEIYELWFEETGGKYRIVTRFIK